MWVWELQNFTHATLKEGLPTQVRSGGSGASLRGGAMY